MTTITMSVTRALSEIKLLDSKIERAIKEGQYAAVQIADKLIAGHIKPEDFAKDALASKQKVEQLIANRNTIKSAIVASNAVTVVKFPSGKEMTVAECIDQKTAISYKRSFLNNLRIQYNNILTTLNRETQKYEEELKKRIEVNFGKETKGKEIGIEEITKNFAADNLPKLIDPVGLKKVIDSLTSEIEEFDTECDFLLSESNTRTDITVEI
jgi:hypothetical protein